MKNCNRCGTLWRGFRDQPHSRDICESCGAYLHACVNCHHFDSAVTSSCKLKSTSFVGARDMQNYCDSFRMFDTYARAREDRVLKAKDAWEELFRR